MFFQVKICILIYFLNCMYCLFVIIKYLVDLGTKLFLFARVIFVISYNHVVSYFVF